MTGEGTLIVVPTFNERENLTELLEGIRSHVPAAHVLVVDDASPDGTAREAALLGERLGAIEVLRRPRRGGLGSAYVEGFQRGLAEGYERLVSMDADLSHDPRHLPALIEATTEADVAVGSRYLRGVSVVNWSLRRLALSVAANAYARRITGLPVRDCTSGFQCLRREVLVAIDPARLRFSGYSFLVEVKYRAHRLGFRLREVPIIFVERRAGLSKIGWGEIARSLWAVWALRLRPGP
jgi:glycosyltransferase involved in cell wall biosynthesis